MSASPGWPAPDVPPATEIGTIGLVPAGPDAPVAGNLVLEDGRILFLHSDGSYSLTPEPPPDPPPDLPPPDPPPPDPTPTVSQPMTPPERAADGPPPSVVPHVSGPFGRLIPTLATLATVAIVGVGVAVLGSQNSFEFAVDSTVSVVTVNVPAIPVTTLATPVIPTNPAITTLEPVTTLGPVGGTDEERAITIIREIIERCYLRHSDEPYVTPESLQYEAVAVTPGDPMVTSNTGAFFTVSVTHQEFSGAAKWVVNLETGHNILVVNETNGGLLHQLSYARLCPAPHLSSVPWPDGDDPFP